MYDFQFKNCSHDGTISYIILPIERLNEALKVLTSGFYPHENVCAAFELCKNAKAVKELNLLTELLIKDGVSIVAVENTKNEIIGISANKIQKKRVAGEISFFEKYLKEHCREKESASVMQFMIDIDAEVNVFEHFQTDKVMTITFLGVLPEYRKLGVGRELVKADLNLMEKLRQNFYGPDVATAMWTSNFSARIKEILDFKTLKFCPYDSLHYNGFRLSEKIDVQHGGVTLSAKKLNAGHRDSTLNQVLEKYFPHFEIQKSVAPEVLAAD